MKTVRRRGGHPRPAPMQGRPPTARLRPRLAPKGGSCPQRDTCNGAGSKAMPVSDPDGEDEGGQASSTLAVSTRLISAAKLLKSNLVTLAQREGGE
ncbi:hypothetical protein BHE74_00035319 [Ensete ventricosum]|nr:hypothetical protein BHE74_00035319 [Ensete ventricosum]